MARQYPRLHAHGDASAPARQCCTICRASRGLRELRHRIEASVHLPLDELKADSGCRPTVQVDETGRREDGQNGALRRRAPSAGSGYPGGSAASLVGARGASVAGTVCPRGMPADSRSPPSGLSASSPGLNGSHESWHPHFDTWMVQRLLPLRIPTDTMLLVCSQERRWPAARESHRHRLRDASGKMAVWSVLAPALTRFHSPGPAACCWPPGLSEALLLISNLNGRMIAVPRQLSRFDTNRLQAISHR